MIYNVIGRGIKMSSTFIIYFFDDIFSKFRYTINRLVLLGEREFFRMIILNGKVDEEEF